MTDRDERAVDGGLGGAVALKELERTGADCSGRRALRPAQMKSIVTYKDAETLRRVSS
jgi:hypothetical protein